MALISCENICLEPDESSEEVIWVAVDELSGHYELAFDHAMILDHCLQRLKNKIQYTSLPVNLLPEKFTLSELQKTF